MASEWCTGVMTMAAECWWVELRARTPWAWKRTMGLSRSPVFDFCRTSSGLSDLIFISLADRHVVHLVAAGDDDESERMLGAARRGLLSSSVDDFAREWGFDALLPAPAQLQHQQHGD